MDLTELTNYLESYAPLNYQEPYDNCGLLVGGFSGRVEKALVTLDCSEAVIDEALKYNCDLIIAHHPIIFRGLKRLTGADHVERTVMKAIKHEIALYAFHTNLDNVVGGVNWKIAERLDLQHCRVLSPKSGNLKKITTFCPEKQSDKVRNAMFRAGGGNLGAYDECSFNSPGTGTFRAGSGANPFVGEPGQRHEEDEVKIEMIFPGHLAGEMTKALLSAHPYEEVAFDIFPLDNVNKEVGSGLIGALKKPMAPQRFLKTVKTAMKCSAIRHTSLLKNKIRNVAVCGGAGGFLLDAAIRNEADILITSDFKYHEFFEADDRIVIADIGHYESEAFTTELIRDIINKKFPKFALRLSHVNTNPVNYYT